MADWELEQALKASLEEYKKEENKPLCGDISAPIPFMKISTPADGDCLFHAIGKEMNKNASTIRKEICEYYDKFSESIYNNLSKKNINLVKIILSDNAYIYSLSDEDLREVIKADADKEIGKQIIDYSKRMKKKSVYGGTPEIMIASIIYERSICVFLYNKNIHKYKYEVFINGNKTIYLFLCNADGNVDLLANHYVLLSLNNNFLYDNFLYDIIREKGPNGIWMLFKSKSKKSKSKKSKTKSKTKKSKSKKSKSKSKKSKSKQ